MGLIEFKISIKTGPQLIIIQEVSAPTIAHTTDCFVIGDQMVEMLKASEVEKRETSK